MASGNGRGGGSSSAAAVLHSTAAGGGESAPSKSAVEFELEAEEQARALELQRKSGGGGSAASFGIRQPYISGILYVELPEAKVRYAIAAGWDRTVTGTHFLPFFVCWWLMMR
jgi:hypothetical protein